MLLMCRALKVTSQGYHQWHKGESKRTERQQKEKQLQDKVSLAHAESCKTYGRIRITRELHAQGEIINEKKVRRLMNMQGLKVKAAKLELPTRNGWEI